MNNVLYTVALITIEKMQKKLTENIFKKDKIV